MEGLPPLVQGVQTSPKKMLRFKDEEETPRRRPSKLPTLQRRASLQAYDPIIVSFVKNGDKFFEGVKLNITQRNMRNWETLLAELSRRIELPAGVRHIYTPEGGCRVKSLSQLEHCKTYVCASSEPFKRMDYGNVRNPDWKAASKVKVSDSGLHSVFSKNFPLSPFNPDTSLSASSRSALNLNGSTSTRNQTEAGLNSSIRQRKFSRKLKPMRLTSISEPQEVHLKSPHHSDPFSLPGTSRSLPLTIIRNGPPPRQNATLYLNKNSIKSWEEAKQFISEVLKTINGCLHLFKLDGEEVQSLSQLWRAGSTLIAVGNESFDVVEFLMGAAGKSMHN